MKDKIKHGTTTVGIVCKDGVVLAADKRATAGHLIANKRTDKVHQISDYMAITTAGLVSDAQLFTRIIRAQLALLRIRKGKEPTVEEAANILASLSYSNIRRPSMVPGIVGFLIAGADKNGHHLYEIGVDGSTDKSREYCSDGSGSVFALGVLEALYKTDMTLDEGVQVAVKAINAALQRDVYTGNGVDVFTITTEGVKKVIAKELDMTLRV